jgi:hypothetical protein
VYGTREENRQEVFEDKMLGRIFGKKKDEMIVGLGKLHNEKVRK